jgi:hypothetical protein
MEKLKDYKEFTIRYWFTREAKFTIYKRAGHQYVTVWLFKKLWYIKGYEDEWGTNWWKHFKLWKIG